MSKCQHQSYPKMSYKNLYSWNNAAGLQYLFIHLMQSKYNSMVSYWKWKAMDSNSYLGVSIDFQGVCVWNMRDYFTKWIEEKDKSLKNKRGITFGKYFFVIFSSLTFCFVSFWAVQLTGVSKTAFVFCVYLWFIGVTALLKFSRKA